jgi:predicted glycosyltransferase
MTDWLIYALGGGSGHLTRASGLARAAPPSTRVRILTNSPYAGCVKNAMPQLDIVPLDPSMTAAAARIEVAREIEAAAADCLIVDTFPRGLGGELADIIPSFPGSTVLVQRDLNPKYAAAFDVQAFVRHAYDLVLDAEAAPWLVRPQHEVLTREEARAALRLQGNKKCVLVCAAGNPDELDWYGDVAACLAGAAAECDVRCIAPVRPRACPAACWLSYWPALDLYAAADVIVGGAGYNTVHECLACDLPLIARPWPRKYDRQQDRANRAANHGAVTIVRDPEEAAAKALETLRMDHQTRHPRFSTGANDAAAAIGQLTATRRA